MAGMAWALALGSTVCFGLALVLTQFGLRHQSATLGAVVSILTSTVLIWCGAPFALDLSGWHVEGALIFAAVGLLFPASVTLLTFEANRRMGPNVAGAVGNLAPLFAVLFAVIALGEEPNGVQGVGIGAIVLGVTVLSTDRQGTTAPWSAWSLGLPLGAAAIRGGTQAAVKAGLAIWPSPFAAALVGYTVSSVVVIVVALTRAGGWPQGHTRIGTAWFACVGLCNGLAVLALYAALARGPVTLVSPLVATYPLVTLILSRVLLHAIQIGPRQIAGVIGTVIGVAILLIA